MSLVASMYLSMSSNSFFGVTRAYICVVLISECPSILLTVSMGTPFSSVIKVENECRPIWNRTPKAAVGKQVTIKRNPFEMSGFALFCRMPETQRSAEWRVISVTKPLAACYRSRDR